MVVSWIKGSNGKIVAENLDNRSLPTNQTSVRDISLSCSGSRNNSFKIAVQFLRVEVEDTGIGLSDEMMNNLFTPFKQAQRLAGGTGLGLFSLSRRVDAIGGRYGVINRRDGQQGSVFWFEIPYKPDLEYANNLMDLSPRALASLAVKSPRHSAVNSPVGSFRFSSKCAVRKFVNPSTTALNILLVEDTLSIQKMTKMLLKKQGHIVTVAENGVEALELIMVRYEEAQSGVLVPQMFDVVLMDFQMPVMDGLEATRRIRALETLLNADNSAGQPFHQLIIGLSANSDDETVQLARSEGMDDFMEKPFKAAVFNEIYERISQV
jgi:CheY-like chemotaxis protein